MIRVFIVDDHPIVRKGLIQILADVPDIVVVGEAADGYDALQRLDASYCHIVLLDLGLPGMGGLETIRAILRRKISPAVLVLSMHPVERYGVRALKAGASGYLTKDSAPELLIDAIRTIHRGHKFITPHLAELLASDLNKKDASLPHDLLSDRELEVMCMIASGLTVTEIARQLNLSVKTISTYRTRLLRKMVLKSNASLTHYAIRHGLLD